MTGLPHLEALTAAATPGPWAAMIGGDREASVFSTRHDRGWVTPLAEPDGAGDGCTDADARLIACAPDLAAALIETTAKLEWMQTYFVDYVEGRLDASLAFPGVAREVSDMLARLRSLDQQIGGQT